MNCLRSPRGPMSTTERLMIQFATPLIRFAILVLVVFGSASMSMAATDVFLGSQFGKSVAMHQIDHSGWDSLLKKYVDADGQVNYRAWNSNAADKKKLDQYLTSLSHGNRRKDKGTALGHRLAFWINAYNAVTIKGILREYPTTSIRNHTAKFFGYNIWKNLKLYVGGSAYSLDQMEHEILRKMNEPRIHFAIVCASKGCPRLLNQAYTQAKLDEQLTMNAKDFFSRRQNFQHDFARKQFKLSSLLSWFGEDFGSSQAKQLQRISPWLPNDAAKTAADRNSVQVSYLDYDWGLNSQ